MENPFKPSEGVATKIKGIEHPVTVNQTYQNEVQVKTAEGKLLWRTMHTVWYPGQSPIPKEAAPADPNLAGDSGTIAPTPDAQNSVAELQPPAPEPAQKQKKRRMKRRGR